MFILIGLFLMTIDHNININSRPCGIFVFHIKEEDKINDVADQGAEKNICTYERGSNGRQEKVASWGAS
jgi:hypothetical protein